LQLSSKYDATTPIQKGTPEIVFITSYPPRECGIATYTQDLKNAILEKFGATFELKICALETGEMTYKYPEEVRYILKTQVEENFSELATKINANKNIAMVFYNMNLVFLAEIMGRIY
jgi:hypothetical protein